MVNMYSMMGSMGMMNGMNSMSAMGGNVHQTYLNKYGVGYEDFGVRPYYQKYPMEITPLPPRSAIQDS